MRFDLENQLSVNQAFPGAATVSTNAFDMHGGDDNAPSGRDMSLGDRMAVGLFPATVAAGAADHVFEVIEADNAALTTGVTVVSSTTLRNTDLVAGSEHELPIPKGKLSKRYLGIRHTGTLDATGAATVTVNAYVMRADEIYSGYKAFAKINNAEV